MVLTTMQSIAIIAVCGICTLLERALPFLIFSGRAVPEPVRYLGRGNYGNPCHLLSEGHFLFLCGRLCAALDCLRGNSHSAPLEKKHPHQHFLRHCLLYGSGAACICIILHNFNRKTLRIFSIRRVLFFNFLIVIFWL